MTIFSNNIRKLQVLSDHYLMNITLFCPLKKPDTKSQYLIKLELLFVRKKRDF